LRKEQRTPSTRNIDQLSKQRKETLPKLPLKKPDEKGDCKAGAQEKSTSWGQRVGKKKKFWGDDGILRREIWQKAGA